MTSVTTRSFHEPALLFDQAGSRLRGAGSHPVIRRSAEKRNGSMAVESAQFVAEQLLQDGASLAPTLHPAFAIGNLLRRPVCKARCSRTHHAMLPGRGREATTESNHKSYHFSKYAKISGATMEASDSMMYFGVSLPSLPQVIFSFGTAPE